MEGIRRETIAILVRNHPGVLSKIAGLFTRRGYNIKSIAAGETEDPRYTRITIVAEGDERTIQQIVHQLQKQIDVIKTGVLEKGSYVGREIALIKVEVSSGEKRLEIMEIVNVFRGKVVDMGKQNMTIEVTGTVDKVNALIEVLAEFGIMEIVRTGRIAILRGKTTIKEV